MKQEIRTVSLRFHEAAASMFNDFSRRKGYVPSWSMDDGWQKAVVVFQSPKEKREFMSGWSKASCEVIDPQRGQRELRLR